MTELQEVLITVFALVMFIVNYAIVRIHLNEKRKFKEELSILQNKINELQDKSNIQE